jgi:exodeoxyribonuclease VII large subunit
LLKSIFQRKAIFYRLLKFDFMQVDALTLLDLNISIKEIIKEHTEKKYWVTGEISELKINYSGHCYLELVQKDKENDQIVARSRATIWATAFRMIKPYFETTTGQMLTEGLSILVKVKVEFHEVYGLSLNITDIEPSFTVGELAVRKQKIVERLTAEGVVAMNKELEIPSPCSKIAVISSSTAAGFGDFIDQLMNNAAGFKFYIKLFSAVMQGEESEGSIINALDAIYDSEIVFDCVVIIRGGGSQADLNCFNSYPLAYHITQFPLPVLTGIGHEQDDSVVDLVAHTRLKTPTAVAAFLIDSMQELFDELIITRDTILSLAHDYVASCKNKLISIGNNLRLSVKDTVSVFNERLIRNKQKLILQSREITHQSEMKINRTNTGIDFLSKRLIREQQALLKSRSDSLKLSLYHMLLIRKHDLASAGSSLLALDPMRILNRGYSITIRDGKIIKDANVLVEGDILETQLSKGKVQTIVKKKIV